jgi:hypothetical protein
MGNTTTNQRCPITFKLNGKKENIKTLPLCHVHSCVLTGDKFAVLSPVLFFGNAAGGLIYLFTYFLFWLGD